MFIEMGVRYECHLVEVAATDFTLPKEGEIRCVDTSAPRKSEVQESATALPKGRAY